ncbi:hypothetical protein CPC08DRAFT_650973 [Agrocybe pediades]|nr:hypothetical protein CPC08DRAFT_650973 [Agrocybe pediades]
MSSRGFFDKSKEGAHARATYLKVFLGGTFAMVILIFTVFSLYWGSLWKTPVKNLPGWVVDFDGGSLGESITQALTTQPQGASKISWTSIPASQFPGGPSEVASLVLDERTWVAVTINAGTTERLSNSLITPNASYSGADAMSVYAVEARSENAFRSLIRPSVQTSLEMISRRIAAQTAQQAANSTNLPSVLTISPQTIVTPVSYQIVNLRPFDIPVATAVTFVGLIYQVILSFFVVMISLRAREESGFDKTLSLRGLIALRFASSFGGYFIISLFYTLLNVAFKVPMNRTFGHAGFVIFWMLNFCGMLCLGLALESLITLLTQAGIPFFMMLWIIANIAVCSFPIQVLPSIFRYGYAAPFYNVSRSIRTIVFGTRNQVGLSFGILIAWIAISCITLPLFQWFVRRRQQKAAHSSQNLLQEEKGSLPSS